MTFSSLVLFFVLVLFLLQLVVGGSLSNMSLRRHYKKMEKFDRTAGTMDTSSIWVLRHISH